MFACAPVALESSLPFGCESTWDHEQEDEANYSTEEVFIAFRL